MQKKDLNVHLSTIYHREFQWFYQLLSQRASYFKTQSEHTTDWVPENAYQTIQPPTLLGDSHYEVFVRKLQQENQAKYPPEVSYLLHLAERMVLLLVLSPYLNPSLTHLLKDLETRAQRPLSAIQGRPYGLMLPCPETVLYLLAGNNLRARQLLQKAFNPVHAFYQEGILEMEEAPQGIPWSYRTLSLSAEYKHLFAFDQEYRPDYSPDFPAQRLTTEQTWDDFVVPYSTHEKVVELLDWIKYYEQLANHPHFARERKGYRCLLVGEPGTGKTMLGRLLSKETNRPVYRISLEKIVSKYVGETTKNLARVFHTARNRNWILFCDEGDALFSKRSAKTQNAQDTYVNQDIAYLLQEIEDYPGVVIVATNYAQNMDKAFQRRFDTQIDFRKPDYGEIIQLFEKALQTFTLDAEIEFSFVAKELKDHITAAQITKLKHYLGLQALKKEDWFLSVEALCEGLQRHYIKIPDFAGRRARMNRYQENGY